MRDQVLWRKISRIIMLLARQLEVSPQRALEIFYETRVSDRLHDPRYGLHQMSDAYILEDIIRELQNREA